MTDSVLYEFTLRYVARTSAAVTDAAIVKKFTPAWNTREIHATLTDLAARGHVTIECATRPAATKYTATETGRAWLRGCSCCAKVGDHDEQCCGGCGVAK